MARPVTIRESDLLEAARQVFLEKGTQATTAQVAQRAGVSEGTLFKRFGTKAELFRAAMSNGEARAPAVLAELDERVGKHDVEHNLVVLGDDLVAFFERMLPLWTMQWSNPRLGGRLPEHLDAPNPPPLEAQGKLQRYLDAEVALGRASIEDTAAFARAFLGALNAYVFFEMLARHQGQAAPRLEAREYVRSHVRILWQGIRPRSVPEARASERRRAQR
jgi:AcrR family transcriptional regulator